MAKIAKMLKNVVIKLFNFKILVIELYPPQPGRRFVRSDEGNQ